MRASRCLAVIALLWAVAPAPAAAQRVPFERTITVAAPATLQVTTDRGKVEVVAGEPGRVVVEGTVTVRVAWDTPANAVDIARQVAASPPVEQVGDVVRLGIPPDRTAQRAVTVSYRVRVPRDTAIRSTSESGATSISGTAGAVDVRTQSAAITVAEVTGEVRITTGSGAVAVDDAGGGVSVTTSSSGFRGSRLGAGLHLRTQSGDVEAALDGPGDVDVQTGSSAIDLRGVRGGLLVKTQSGQVTVRGAPRGDWSATTGSSRVNLALDRPPAFLIDAASRSGQVDLVGARVDGVATRHEARGIVGNGGPTVRVRTGSGAIRVEVADR